VKKAVFYITVGCVLTLGAVQLSAVPASKATIMGEVIDIASYAMKDSLGEENAEAGRFRAEGGFPIGILTEEGDVYVAIYRKPAPASVLETANAVLGELMGKQVVARGRTFDAAGVKVIEVSIASEM
jgi:hypothetical protein